ncbi:hypothetical protein F0562_000434 [Nyssa sinensis]|uniref:PGG domain-containing protein n=1 Tax=Nyssa sinensis TaxID=561372 RepID=A0A5J5C3P4_9ASTE|nr:hypothetical protein F0562_000434 [Nyssa sinensis]
MQNSIKDQLQNAGATFGWRNGITRYEKKVPAGKKDEIEKDIRKIADTHLIVAALIATVTFAAGFTMPGGYGNEDPNKGMAVLARQAAFQIFAISNTIAMISSTCAVFFHFIASGYTDKAKVVNRLAMAIYLIIIAVLTMLVAFIAGMFGVLVHSLGLAISIGIIDVWLEAQSWKSPWPWLPFSIFDEMRQLLLRDASVSIAASMDDSSLSSIGRKKCSRVL